MLYTFIVSISIPNCKSIAHFLSPKWGVFYLQKHTNYDVRFQSRFLLLLGVVRKNKWHHWIPEEKLVQMPPLPPVPIRRYRLHASIHGRHPLSPEAKLVMHCGLCCDALWVTADAAAGARPGAPATTMDFRPREALFFGDNFFRFGPFGSKFSHLTFQPKRRFLSIWSVDKKSIIRVLVIAS